MNGGRKMKFEDMKGVIKKGEFSVESIENLSGDYYTVKLKNDADITWVPGEHGIFTLPGKKIEGRKFRLFSVASIPEEGFILIGTRTGKEISSFKKAFLTMVPNEKVALRGPFGWFKIQDETSPIVIFAGGVGITPIRALLKQMEFNTDRPIEVVYSSSGYHLFGNEIENMVMNNPMFQLYKMASREETAVKLDELVDHYGNAAYYYNSGSPAVLRSVKKRYRKKGIKKNRIISDLLIGAK